MATLTPDRLQEIYASFTDGSYPGISGRTLKRRDLVHRMGDSFGHFSILIDGAAAVYLPRSYSTTAEIDCIGFFRGLSVFGRTTLPTNISFEDNIMAMRPSRVLDIAIDKFDDVKQREPDIRQLLDAATIRDGTYLYKRVTTLIKKSVEERLADAVLDSTAQGSEPLAYNQWELAKLSNSNRPQVNGILAAWRELGIFDTSGSRHLSISEHGVAALRKLGQGHPRLLVARDLKQAPGKETGGSYSPRHSEGPSINSSLAFSQAPLSDKLRALTELAPSHGMTVRFIPKGQLIYDTDQPASQMKLLVAGEGYVYCATKEGEEVGMGLYRAPSLLAKNLSPDNNREAIAAEAFSNSVTLSINLDRQHPLNSFSLLSEVILDALLTDHAYQIKRQITAGKPLLEQRTADVILDLSSDGRDQVETTQERIAALAHATRASVNKIMGLWQDSGSIPDARFGNRHYSFGPSSLSFLKELSQSGRI